MNQTGASATGTVLDAIDNVPKVELETDEVMQTVRVAFRIIFMIFVASPRCCNDARSVCIAASPVVDLHL